MSLKLGKDPADRFRKLEKALLMLRFFWRFPRSHGAWPKYEYIKPWIADLNPAAVVDVEVNMGQFLHLARKLWPDAVIIGVEPTPDLCRRMEEIYQGDARVVMHQCAAGDETGEAEFFITRNHQNSSLLPPSDSFGDDRPDDGVVAREKVQVRRCDDLLEGDDGPFFVKIDVQGAELEVLKGFGPRIVDVATIVIEAPFEKAYEGASDFDAIYRYLSERGFAYEGALGTLTSPATGRVRQEDAVFVRKEAQPG